MRLPSQRDVVSIATGTRHQPGVLHAAYRLPESEFSHRQRLVPERLCFEESRVGGAAR